MWAGDQEGVECFVFSAKKKTAQGRLSDCCKDTRDLACRTVVTLTGCSQAVIENYRSILKLTEEEIIVSTFSGKLTIMGKNLEIPWYTMEEMTVTGKISRIIPER